METHIPNMGLNLTRLLRKQFMKTSHLIIRTILAVTGMAIIISGCSASLKNSMVRPAVSPAAIVQVNQQLEIPNGKARVYIQDGAVTTWRNIDKWSTYCSVLMQQKHASGEPKLSVLPGQFKITKVIESEDGLGTGRTYVASLGWIIDAKGYDRSVHVIFGVEMRLSSADQAGVRALICEKRADNLGHYNYPTLAEIKTALGDTIEIKSP